MLGHAISKVQKVRKDMQRIKGKGKRGFLSLLDIEDRVSRVHGSLVLRRLTNQTLFVGERNKRGGSVATLLVGNYIESVSSP